MAYYSNDLQGYALAAGSRVHYGGADYFYEPRDNVHCYLYTRKCDVGNKSKRSLVVRKQRVIFDTDRIRKYRLGLAAYPSTATDKKQRLVDRLVYETKYFTNYEDAKADCMEALKEQIGSTYDCEMCINNTCITFTLSNGAKKEGAELQVYTRNIAKYTLDEPRRWWHTCLPVPASYAISLMVPV